ncbi:MAG TPA: hypothetical protein VF468_01505, partial [Actinomycetota bacterium]|nr:hypothetical protein [Actinomycetota bacterium]
KEAAERLSAWRQACGPTGSSVTPVGHPPEGGPAAGGSGGVAPDGDPAPAGEGRPRPSLPAAVDAALAADLDTPGALAAGDELAERGDGPGVAAAAAVLGVELSPAGG